MAFNADAVTQASKAILTNDLAALKELIKAGFPINELVFHENLNLLQYATEERKPKIVRYLLDMGADPNCKNNQFAETALHIACRDGDSGVVDLLLPVANLDQMNGAGARAIINAIKSRDGLNLVKKLHKAGASLASQGRFGLLHAAAQQSDPKIIDFLVTKGCDVNEVVAGATPLMIAIIPHDSIRVNPKLKKFGRRPSPQIIQTLLNHGADPLAIYQSNQSVEKGMDTTGKSIAEYVQEVGLPKAIIAMLTSTTVAKQSPGRMSTPKVKNAKKIATSTLSAAEAIKAISKMNKVIGRSLRPGAKRRSLEHISQEAQQKLPDEFLSIWASFDGQQPGSVGIFNADAFEREYRMLSIKEIILEWYAWYDLMMSGEFTGATVSTDGKVRRVWYHEAWIPIAADGAGNFLCVDLNPTSKGQFGQLISLDHEEPDRRAVASSLQQAFSRVLDSHA